MKAENQQPQKGSSGSTSANARVLLAQQQTQLKDPTFRDRAEGLAAVILEPIVQGAGGMWFYHPDYLRGLRKLCDKSGALLIFDEVITGFRLASGGAQEYFGVRADLVTFGKIIGGGMPVGAYCGSRALMEQVAPCGPVYQAGTLSGNPVAMAAGLAAKGRESADVILGVRPEHIAVQKDPSASAIEASIEVSELMGSELHLHMTAGGKDVVAVVQTANLDPNAYARHTAVRFSFEPRLIHLFDPETEKNLI